MLLDPRLNPCPRCNAPGSYAAPAGLCARCLMANALDSGPTGLGPGATGGSGTTREMPGLSRGTMPRVFLPDTDGGATPAPLVKPSSGEMPAMADRPPRVELLGEIARGGMGAILKGRDPDLGRDLAVKVLLEAHRDKPDLVRRFVEEAQIGGQLQHPGVVPVYEPGRFGDARPYFTMKLVKGRTLAELLADRDGPEDDRPRFLSIFLQVALTVAYAHARGVIHRDLKPSNVMVGSFGEVQVMDWGLAKVLRRGGAAADASAGLSGETVIATLRSMVEFEADLSVTGSVLGTPSYMAPEQARGETDRVDERADVFALGSILAEILTGRPAFTGKASGEILRKAARGDLSEVFARLEGSGADPDLAALARDCLGTEPEDRPDDAQAVADRLGDHLNSVHRRLRDAELARAAERARADEAKRTAMAESARAEASEARARAERRARRLQLGLAASLIVLMALGGGGYAWARQQRDLRIARNTRAVEAALDEAIRLRGEAQADPRGGPGRWREALSAARLAESLLVRNEANESLQSRVDSLLAQLKQMEADRALLTELESIHGDRAVHDNLHRTNAAYAEAFRKAGLDLDRMGAEEAGRWVAARSEPAELAAYLDDWASISRRAIRTGADDWKRLVGAARAADPDPWRDALRAKLGATDEPALAELRRLADDGKALEAQPAAGLILLARRLTDDGVDEDRKLAASVLRRVATRHPGDFWAHFELANLATLDCPPTDELRSRFLGQDSSREEVVRHLTAAIAIRPGSSSAHYSLGHALEAQEKLAEAVAEYREALRLKPDSSWVQLALYSTLQLLGKLEQDVATWRESGRLASDDPWAHANLAGALKAQGKYDEAALEFLEAIRLKPDMLLAHVELGGTLFNQGKFIEAVDPWSEAVRLNPDDAIMHKNLAFVLSKKREFSEAFHEYREAIRLKPNFIAAHFLLADLLKSRGKYDEAAAEYRETIRLKPDAWDAFAYLGDTLFAMKGKRAEAIAAWREAIRLQPGFALLHHKIGYAQLMEGHPDQAAEALQRARALQPKASSNISDRIDVDLALVPLVRRVGAVLRGEDRPASPAEGHSFALLCYAQGRYAFAARLSAEALAADPELADDLKSGHRYNAACSAALAGCGKGNDEPAPDEAERAGLRTRARDWLRADFALRDKQLETGTELARAEVERRLDHWKVDHDLAGVRDPESLERLPVEEARAWRDFWTEVDILLEKALAPRP